MRTVTAEMRAIDPADVESAVELTSWTDVIHVFRSRVFDVPQPEHGFGWDWQARMMGDAVNHLQGEAHLERRRLLSTLFRPENLQRYERRVLLPTLHGCLDALEAERDAGGRVRADLAALAETVLMALMAELIGLDGIAFDAEGLERFRTLFRQLDAGNRVRYTTGDPEAVLAAGLAAQRVILDEFFEPARGRYQALLADVAAGRAARASVPENLITLMLSSREHYDRWGPHVYGREVSLFIGASIGSTATSICNAFVETEDWIAAHPEDAGRRLDEDFLLRCLHEAIRLRGTMWLTRVAMEDAVLPSGLGVPAGRLVWLNLHRSYADALGAGAFAFDPHRELPERFARYGGSFGDGRHVCLGKTMIVGAGLEADERRGTALTVLRELYRLGMRRDAGESHLSSSVRQKFVTCPIVFPVSGGRGTPA